MATKIDLAVSMVLDSKGVVVGFRDVKNKVRDLEGQFMKLNDTLKEVKRGSEEFQGAASRAMETYQKQTRTAGTATSNFKSKLDDMFKPITTLNQAFGLLQQSLYVVQRAFELTVGSAIDLELQVARINTVLDESERGQVDFAKQILQMQATFGANPTEAAKGFYEAIASGATNAAGSIELMATAQKLAIGGLLPLDKALSGLTAVMASYGYTAEQTKFISDGFFIAAAKGKTNVEELTQEIGNVSSIAQQSGVSFAELVSSISAVTLGGKRTAEATTSVRSAINALLTPTEQLQYVFDQLNIKSVTQEIRQRGLAAVYKDIYKYVNNNADSLAKLVGRIEAISAVVALTTGKQADAYRAMVDDINNSNRQMGERTDQAFKIIKETSAESLKRAKESISASFTDISQIAMKLVVPAMTAIATALNAILKPIVFVTDQMEKFADSLSDYVAPSILAISGIISAISLGAIPVLGALTVALKGLITPILILSAKFIAIASVIAIVMAAVDSFVRNWELIPVAFEYVIAKFDEIKIRFFKLMNDMFIGLANIISDNAKKFPKIAEIFGLSDFAEKSKSQLNLVNEQFGQELDKTVKRAEEAKKKIVSTFDVGAFGALKDIGKSIFSGGPEQIFGPPKPPQTGAPGLPETEQKPGKDIGKAIEDRNKLQEQLNTMLGNTARYEEEIRMSQVYGNDSLRESLKIEFEKIDTLAAQLEKHKALTAEQQKGIVKFKETAAKAIEIKVNTENIKQATGYINAAAGGADAVVSKAINQVGAAFGPKGEMIAAAVNLLRMGGEQMKTLGQGLIQVFVELPLKVAEGAVGLVQGMIDGVINMLADPAKLAKISTAIITLVPKIITALAKGIPVVLKTLLNPSFWVELVAQIVRSIFDAFKEMFFAIGDLIAGIFTGDIFTPDEEKAVDFGTTAAESFNSSIQMSTGYGEQLFGVQNEGIQAALQGVEATAQKVNKSFADGVKKQDSWWNKFVKDWHSFWTDFDQNFLKKIWDGFGDIFRSLWEGIKGFSSALGDFFGKIWEVLKGFIGSIGQVFVELWGTLKEIGKFIWDGIVSVSKEIGDFFVDIGKKVWDGIESTAGKIGDFFKNLGSKIWDGLKDAIKSFGGAIADFLGFSDGGIVPGLSLTSGDNPKNDTVPTLLSPGEAVIPRSLMANPEINKMIKNLLNNRQMPLSIDVGMPRIAMANGGVVPLNPIISNNGGTTFGDTNINVVLKIDTKEPIDETFIRQRLIPAMKAELKASSLRGDFVLSSKGVRR